MDNFFLSLTRHYSITIFLCTSLDSLAVYPFTLLNLLWRFCWKLFHVKKNSLNDINIEDLVIQSSSRCRVSIQKILQFLSKSSLERAPSKGSRTPTLRMCWVAIFVLNLTVHGWIYDQSTKMLRSIWDNAPSRNLWLI